VLKKISQHKIFYAVLSGLCLVAACPSFDLWPFVFLSPIFTHLGLRKCHSYKDAFLQGYFTSLVAMIGIFYWVSYVIHVFGDMNWGLSFVLYAAFAGFGALNFPAYTCLAYGYQKGSKKPFHKNLGVLLFLPSLFVFLEYLIPKLFPWSLGHTFYKTLWVNQVAELTGTPLIAWAIWCAGLFALEIYSNNKSIKKWMWVPISAWIFIISFSIYRIVQPYPTPKKIRVGVVQANIGSLDKVLSKQGLQSKIDQVTEKYIAMSEVLFAGDNKPQLVVWPETAIPYTLDTDHGLARKIYDAVKKWNVPLITGGYFPNYKFYGREYNSAYLLEPHDDWMKVSNYHKNVLLAFGEYMPLGDTFPWLYRLFPAVSNFSRGTEQKHLELKDGTRLGVSICYEAILPQFYRKIMSGGVHLGVNLTNDSWFGPTGEPHLHASISTFRAIESRVPIIRSTNTGISMVIDTMGRMAPTTPVYAEASFIHEVSMPENPPNTIYVKFGDWFIWLCIIFCALGFYYVPLSFQFRGR